VRNPRLDELHRFVDVELVANGDLVRHRERQYFFDGFLLHGKASFVLNLYSALLHVFRCCRLRIEHANLLRIVRHSDHHHSATLQKHRPLHGFDRHRLRFAGERHLRAEAVLERSDREFETDFSFGLGVRVELTSCFSASIVSSARIGGVGLLWVGDVFRRAPVRALVGRNSRDRHACVRRFDPARARRRAASPGPES
jgi:hypothetical protein